MPTYSPERLKAVHIIEALRSGVPSQALTRELPDLRMDLTNYIRQDLNELTHGNIPCGRVIWGKYGQGKSHFLTVVEHIALDMGFAVSTITLGRQLSLRNLRDFYRSVAPIVKVPNSLVPGIHSNLSKQGRNNLPGSHLMEQGRYSHNHPAIVVECMLRGTQEDFQELYNVLVGDRLPISDIRAIAKKIGIGSQFEGLPRFTKDYWDSFFGVFADTTCFCGFHGWVILIDEVELIARLGRVGRLEAYRNLNWLLNFSHEIKYPIYTVAAATNDLQKVWSEGIRSRPPDRDAMPELAWERYGRIEKQRIGSFFNLASSDCKLDIERVSRSQLDELMKKIISLHSIAHDWPEPTLDNVKGFLKISVDDPIRVHIRATLEALDSLSMSGDSPEIQPSELEEPSVKEEPEFFKEDDN